MTVLDDDMLDQIVAALKGEDAKPKLNPKPAHVIANEDNEDNEKEERWRRVAGARHVRPHAALGPCHRSQREEGEEERWRRVVGARHVRPHAALGPCHPSEREEEEEEDLLTLVAPSSRRPVDPNATLDAKDRLDANETLEAPRAGDLEEMLTDTPPPSASSVPSRSPSRVGFPAPQFSAPMRPQPFRVPEAPITQKLLDRSSRSDRLSDSVIAVWQTNKEVSAPPSGRFEMASEALGLTPLDITDNRTRVSSSFDVTPAKFHRRPGAPPSTRRAPPRPPVHIIPRDARNEPTHVREVSRSRLIDVTILLMGLLMGLLIGIMTIMPNGLSRTRTAAKALLMPRR